jgi:hypothetical protein
MKASVMAKSVKPPAGSGKTAKKERTIKYTDKSPGQPELVPIFEAIKKLMAPYEKGHLRFLGEKAGQVVLISDKEVVIDGRKREELWFVSALVQKGYVGFYYMPVYMNEPVRRQLPAEFLKCLKGKACFHIKKNDPLLLGQIKEALKIGYEDYKAKGWI